MRFAKGHGTQNDFVILTQAQHGLELNPELVAEICDRRRGIGADGLLNVDRRDDAWFMDYRNADGSAAEMCGNGVRVFAHWLATREGLSGDTFEILTRAGLRTVRMGQCSPTCAEVTVEMGPAEVTGVSTAQMGDFRFAGLGVDVGNPHLAAVIPGLTPTGLAELELSPPAYDEDFFPQGVNVEILTPLQDDTVHMRVIERGVGETRSCGTGTVAAARAALADAGRAEGRVSVNVPGGRVEVDIAEQCLLTGPSRILAEGEFYLLRP
ncbi:diaminopimelate epimerase [Corynebacterium yudongzhengii]|uniref:Diaminopimelate epimerase n=1 Tax=Corynebacterium yudongzhengii TaxID=2080740 RepID=A0A2U1T5M5_9CORY|nr:diaminopimelate epimerase [Corynebacterium yudongzhengii]AWB82950.1 diaminopimelate epimerase [Corynebacterium yudongzhengii]PWC01198.1 diaminopimelate epimerase [Corynebacterium yudongzhengii]